jgi:hypothetical protein
MLSSCKFSFSSILVKCIAGVNVQFSALSIFGRHQTNGQFESPESPHLRPIAEDVGVRGGTIYTTYFPCELCAKKIYQTGLKEIIYTEPYPESVSQDVFLKDGIRKIGVTQFEGVKSHSYFRLFKAALDKKEAQQMPGL